MERFGDELRRERMRRKVSMESISEETKISVRHLEALEAGEYDSLPGGVFRKGIVRSYLAAVGLEETPWIERACGRAALRTGIPTGPSSQKMSEGTEAASSRSRTCDGWASELW